MTRKWAPGDVALVRNEYDVWNLAVCSVKAGHRGFVWQYGVADSWAPLTAEARPLVVIDPEDREQVARLEAEYFAHRRRANGAHWMADALHSLITPPKPEEPTGLGAVIEDEDGIQWVRSHLQFPSTPWTRCDRSGCVAYSVIAAVKVLSPGVTQ